MTDLNSLKHRSKKMELVCSGFLISVHNKHSPDGLEFSMFHDGDHTSPPVISFAHLKGGYERQGLYSIHKDLFDAIKVQLVGYTVDNFPHGGALKSLSLSVCNLVTSYEKTQHAIGWFVLPSNGYVKAYKILSHLPEAIEFFEECYKLKKQYSEGKTPIGDFVQGLINTGNKTSKDNKTKAEEFRQACDELPVLLKIPGTEHYEISKIVKNENGKLDLKELVDGHHSPTAIKNSLGIDVNAAHQNSKHAENSELLASEIEKIRLKMDLAGR